VGSDADSCFDDSRASVEFEDAFGWFIDRFKDDESMEEKFDVFIMDALDPDKLVDIVGSLYKDNDFVQSLFNGLSDNGVFVVQVGEADSLEDAALEAGPAKDTAHMMEGLKNAGFESMHGYDEFHSHFYDPWSYLICFKGIKSRESWYKTSAKIEIELHQRLHRTKSGKHSLLYFDAPTMINYQVAPKVEEVVYCRKDVAPWGCDQYLGGQQPGLLNARNSTIGKPAYDPVFERHSQHILGMGARETTSFSEITHHLSSTIQETMGEEVAGRL